MGNGLWAGLRSNQTRTTSIYGAEIARTPVVSDPTEERQLIWRWQKKKDLKAREALVQSHLRFVVQQARRRTKDPERVKDLTAAGNVGLLLAADRYDLRRRPALRFLTYAGWWVRKEMSDLDYATSTLVHVPTHRQKAQRRKARDYQLSLRQNGPGARDALDPGVPDGATVPLELSHEAEAAEADTLLFETLETSQTHALLRDLISGLPLREQTVLNLYFGVKDEPRNLVQIAALMDRSSEHVRQIKINGMRLLKGALEQHMVAV